MKLLKYSSLLIFAVFLLYSCSSDNDTIPDYQPTLIRDYAIQYNEDIVKIENYLKTHSVSITNNPGFVDDQNAIFTNVSNLDIDSMWGSDAASPKSSLLTKIVNIEGVAHKIYYIKFRDGIGLSPNSNSQVKAYFKGFLLDDTVFGESVQTGMNLEINQLIIGWREILPEFKMGTVTGIDQYEYFGAGVMFLPSALAYYQYAQNQIPAYSPVMFNIKLFEVL